jgi:hypothetical protein
MCGIDVDANIDGLDTVTKISGKKTNKVASHKPIDGITVDFAINDLILDTIDH